jgi:hypothetical protein
VENEEETCTVVLSSNERIFKHGSLKRFANIASLHNCFGCQAEGVSSLMSQIPGMASIVCVFGVACVTIAFVTIAFVTIVSITVPSNMNPREKEMGVVK